MVRTRTKDTDANDATNANDANDANATPATSSQMNDASVASSNDQDSNAAIISSFLNLMKTGAIKIPGIIVEKEDSADLDKHFRTPPFTVPSFDEAVKLKGHRNYRQWKAKLDLSLRANMLLPFIQSENGQEIRISENYRSLLNARTQQTLEASVTRSIALQFRNAKSPYEAFLLLEKNYSSTRMRDLVDLNRKLQNLTYRVGFDAARFVADFELSLIHI